jgi:hypothetical protein
LIFAQVLSRKLTTGGKLQLRTFDQFTEVSLLREALLDRPNASMFAAGLQTGRKEFKAVSDALGLVATNVNRSGKNEHPFGGITGDLFSCSEFFQKHPEHHDVLRELLQAADIGIEDFKILPVSLQAEGGEAKESFLIFFEHEGPNGRFELAVNRESSGTRRLFMLFGEGPTEGLFLGQIKQQSYDRRREGQKPTRQQLLITKILSLKPLRILMMRTVFCRRKVAADLRAAIDPAERDQHLQ